MTSLDATISTSATDFLWAMTGIHILSFLILLALCFVAPEPNRVFHYTYTFVLLVVSTTAFAQAAGLFPVCPSSSSPTQPQRLISLPEYIGKTTIVSAQALSLGILSGISWTTTILNIASAIFWILVYLAAALTPTSPSSTSHYRWALFAFGTLAFLILSLSLLNECREEAMRRNISRDYTLLAGWACALLALYIVLWALGDGSRVLGTTASVVWVGVLDVALLEGTAFGFIFLGRRWSYESLGLAFSDVRMGRRGAAVGGMRMRIREEEVNDVKHTYSIGHIRDGKNARADTQSSPFRSLERLEPVLVNGLLQSDAPGIGLAWTFRDNTRTSAAVLPPTSCKIVSEAFVPTTNVGRQDTRASRALPQDPRDLW
ncbi:FDD123-like protein 1 [Paraphaeosphaeria sporulosa]